MINYTFTYCECSTLHFSETSSHVQRGVSSIPSTKMVISVKERKTIGSLVGGQGNILDWS